VITDKNLQTRHFQLKTMGINDYKKFVKCLREHRWQILPGCYFRTCCSRDRWRERTELTPTNSGTRSPVITCRATGYSTPFSKIASTRVHFETTTDRRLRKELNFKIRCVGENGAVRVVYMLALSILRYVLMKSKCRKNSRLCNPKIPIV
jgi:hypothetical protein